MFRLFVTSTIIIHINTMIHIKLMRKEALPSSSYVPQKCIMQVQKELQKASHLPSNYLTNKKFNFLLQSENDPNSQKLMQVELK